MLKKCLHNFTIRIWKRNVLKDILKFRSHLLIIVLKQNSSLKRILAFKPLFLIFHLNFFYEAKCMSVNPQQRF